MGKNSTIEHKGVISEITDSSIFVELNVQSACASCRANSVCGIDNSLKTVEVRTNDFSYSIGDNVKVILKESLGMKALFLGYVMPFIVVVVTFFALSEAGVGEALSGIIAIVVLAPYYLGLYLLNDKIKKEFNFNIEKV